MDAIEILGSLLGGSKPKGGGSGGSILADILKGGRPTPKPKPPSATGRAPASRVPTGPTPDFDQQAKELEDLLGVAHDRSSSRARVETRQPPAVQSQPPTRQSSPNFPDLGGSMQPKAGPTVFPSNQPDQGQALPRQQMPVGPADALSQNDEALIMVRAMINAAKADGRVTPDEQNEILNRLANPTQDIIDFLRREFSQPVDVREFAWSVPLGMEQKVYTLSLASIDLDTNPEASYLRELAHGLRMHPETINQIHQQYGAPLLF